MRDSGPLVFCAVPLVVWSSVVRARCVVEKSQVKSSQVVNVSFELSFGVFSCFRVDCGALYRVRVVYHGFPQGF